MMFQKGKNRIISISAITMAALLGFFSSNCEKVEPVRLILIETGAVSEVTQTSCSVSATLFDVGEGTGVNQHGFCVSLTASVNDASNCSQLGAKSQKGVFNGQLTGLTPGTVYYVWAYASKGDETVYGKSLSFQTSEVEATLAQLTTIPVEQITWNSAVGGGNITSNGGAEVTERGICWNTSPNPSIDNYSEASGSGTGEYTAQMTELVPETDYYVKAYAINSAGTAYGNEQVIGTPAEPGDPVLGLVDIEGVSPNSATGTVNIISDGGAEIISKGFCWSTEPNPTLANSSLEYGSGGSEPYTMEISGLDHDTEYYVRAYATNEADKTGYGGQVAFRTEFLCGSFLVDERDGKQYVTISIGDVCWMAQNLDHGEIISIGSEQTENEIIEKFCYEDNPGNCETYGGLYTWDEMMQYTTTEMSQGICPAGWHIPSDNEWKAMEMALGMTEDEVNNEEWRGTDQGDKLKDTSGLWNTGGGTNTSQFSALPSGMVYHDGTLGGIGDFAVFWTSTPDGETDAWYRYLHTDENRVYRVIGYRPNTSTVRCVKD